MKRARARLHPPGRAESPFLVRYGDTRRGQSRAIIQARPPRGSAARSPAGVEPIALARYAVGKALRALGRSDEAVTLLEQAVAWAESEGAPDGWYHEELALEYDAIGRAHDAREQARRGAARGGHRAPGPQKDDVDLHRRAA